MAVMMTSPLTAELAPDGVSRPLLDGLEFASPIPAPQGQIMKRRMA
jgi:hypothetical protein